MKYLNIKKNKFGGFSIYPPGEGMNPLQYSCLENPHVQRNLAGCSPWGQLKY